MRYNAFISYRHLPKDKFVAETLHKTLESFKLPKSLYDKCEKHSIERVFRDRDELPLSSNLSDPIDAALKESEFLIVICTPQLKESRWCLREIETFKALHGREKIYAVLADGEPVDSFPDELLFEEYEEKDENGNTVIKRRSVEPLAADVRGKNNREIRKKIKEETVRLVAPMFGLNYDDLKQRHREREIKRKIRYISIIAAFFLVFGIVSSSMAYAIHKQNIEIKKNYAESLCAESISLFAEGNLYEARERAELALSYSDSEKPRQAYDVVYERNTAYGAHILYDTYEMEDGVNGMFISPNGKYLAIVNGLSRISVVDTKTGKETRIKDETTSCMAGYIDFISDSKFAYNSADGLKVYDFDTEEENVLTTGYSKVVVSDDRKMLGVVTLDEVSFYDTDSLKMLSKVSLDVNSDCAADFDKHSDLFAVAMSGADLNSGYVTVINPSNGQTVAHNPFKGGAPVSITCTDKGYALSLCDAMSNDVTSLNAVYQYDISGELNWKTDDDALMYAYVDYCNDDAQIYTYQSDRIMSLDSNTGKINDLQSINGAVYLCTKTDDGKYTLTLLDSNVVEYNAPKEATRMLVNYDVLPTLSCSQACMFGKDLYIHFQGMDYVSVYKIPEGEEVEEIAENATEYVATEHDGVIFFQEAISTAYMYDENLKVPDSETASLLIHSADKNYYACYGDGKSVRVYPYGGDTPLYTLAINTGTINYMFFSEDGGWFVVNYQNGTLELYDAQTGIQAAVLEKDYPYVFDVINLPKEDTVIVDAAYETLILNSDYSVRTKYQKTGESMCVGFDMESKTLLVQNGESISAVPVK